MVAGFRANARRKRDPASLMPVCSGLTSHAGALLSRSMSERASQPSAAERACYDARGTDAFDAAGVDVTLIDWMLSLTPRERLEALFVYATSTARLSPSARSD